MDEALMNEMLKKVTPNMIRQRYDEWIEILEVDEFINLSKKIGGETSYIPTLRFYLNCIQDQANDGIFNNVSYYEISRSEKMRENIINELKEKMTPDMIQYPYDEWVDVIGIEKMIDLSVKFGGATAYIPKPDFFMRNVRNEAIKSEFTGFNYRELASKYGLSIRMIKIICDKKGGNQNDY